MNSLKMHPELIEFIEYIDMLVKNTKETEVSITQKVAVRMKEIMFMDEVIPEIYRKPNPDKYTLYPVYVAPDNSFSIASAVWDVGQSTPIHNHGTWGVIGIVQGGEHEIHYEVTTGAAPVKISEQTLEKGDVVVCCTSDQDIHKVSCATKEPCVGIHVYGGNIGEIERRVFDPLTGVDTIVVTAWDPVPNE
ncbi:hypothetical protein V7122_22500 [Bacillus sp. JJ1532]|uniref:cysteine dioxygenase family protein n=1 Tax=Bacillus sp. JJ1532 TaxID=3122958 RepID=UPI002FFEE3DD